MSTRLYLTNDTAPFSPSFNGSYATTASALRKSLGLTKVGTNAVVTYGSQGTGTGDLFVQFVSIPLTGNVTISGTQISYVYGINRANTAQASQQKIHVWVSQGTTSTARGVLISNRANSVSLPTTNTGEGETGLSVTTVNALTGDCIVVEIAIGFSSSFAGGSGKYGGTGSDLAIGSTTAANCGWIEFVANLPFSAAPTIVPIAAADSTAATAYALGRAKTTALGLATAAASAYALTRQKVRSLAVASMVNTNAYMLGKLKSVVLGSPVVVSSAYVVTPVKTPSSIVVNLGSATVAGTAYPFTWSKVYPPLGEPSVTATAYLLAIAKRITLSKATDVTATAYALARSKAVPLGAAAVAATAYSMGRAKVMSLGTASVAATAYAITPHSPQNVHLLPAECHAVAYPIGVKQFHPPWQLSWWFKPRGNNVPYWSEKEAEA